MTSETIFHIGLAVIGCSAAVLAAGLAVISSKQKSLKTILDKEYGEQEKRGADNNG